MGEMYPRARTHARTRPPWLARAERTARRGIEVNHDRSKKPARNAPGTLPDFRAATALGKSLERSWRIPGPGRRQESGTMR